MGWLIIAGGLFWNGLGMLTFGYFKGIDKIDLVITLALYVCSCYHRKFYAQRWANGR